MALVFAGVGQERPYGEAASQEKMRFAPICPELPPPSLPVDGYFWFALKFNLIEECYNADADDIGHPLSVAMGSCSAFRQFHHMFL